MNQTITAPRFFKDPMILLVLFVLTSLSSCTQEEYSKYIDPTIGNVSRFLVLSKESAGVPGDKCSIIFVGEHRAGALFRVLKEFADADINLTRIESMPSRDVPGNYVFFLDFQGSIQDAAVKGVLRKVEEMILVYKFLGCYPAANL